MKKVFDSFLYSYLSVAIFSLFFVMETAWAAPLNYSSDAYISITSPTITLTISSGSVADTLVTNATNTVVTMSSGTGGSFTITAASSDLTVSASAGGGTASVTCGGANVATVVISQTTGAANYTITPTSAKCALATVTTFGGGGLVPGTGLAIVAPTTTASIPMPKSSSDQLIQLQALLKQLAILRAKISDGGVVGRVYFTRAFGLGEKGEDIRSLQIFLNNQGFIISNSGAGSPGKETNKFGSLTQKALCRFQVSKGIVKKSKDNACGIFGPKTRGVVNGR